MSATQQPDQGPRRYPRKRQEDAAHSEKPAAEVGPQTPAPEATEKKGGAETILELAEAASKVDAQAPPQAPPGSVPAPAAAPLSPKEVEKTGKGYRAKARLLIAERIVKRLESDPDLPLPVLVQMLEKLTDIDRSEEWDRELIDAIKQSPGLLNAGGKPGSLTSKLAAAAQRVKKAQAGDKRQNAAKPTGTEGPMPLDD